MDPFARKMILGAVAFGSVMALFIAIFSIVYFHEKPRCSEQVLAESLAPGAQWMAAVLQRRCGEDAPFLVHVNVRSPGDSIRLGYFSGQAAEGEVFVAEQETVDVVPELEWKNAELVIRCAACRASLIRKRDNHIGVIAIHYELGR